MNVFFQMNKYISKYLSFHLFYLFVYIITVFTQFIIIKKLWKIYHLFIFVCHEYYCLFLNLYLIYFLYKIIYFFLSFFVFFLSLFTLFFFTSFIFIHNSVFISVYTEIRTLKICNLATVTNSDILKFLIIILYMKFLFKKNKYIWIYKEIFFCKHCLL